MANDLKFELPEMPEPDGDLYIDILGHPIPVNAYRDSTVVLHVEEVVELCATVAQSTGSDAAAKAIRALIRR